MAPRQQTASEFVKAQRDARKAARKLIAASPNVVSLAEHKTNKRNKRAVQLINGR